MGALLVPPAVGVARRSKAPVPLLRADTLPCLLAREAMGDSGPSAADSPADGAGLGSRWESDELGEPPSSFHVDVVTGWEKYQLRYNAAHNVTYTRAQQELSSSEWMRETKKVKKT
ncbi:hypothetical protein NDU88_002811 [Pleurodeles waltl]|uniref:Uncharacterized protein n=1 Tax=Pleurodeles waltl TaxID=8319 RepID=A0AAV7KT73_PLEWA|nr:hypothetical protein NDU88_002811 [Pleurodeles waltl]